MKQETSNRGFFQNPNTQTVLIIIGIVVSLCCLLGSLAGMFLLDEVTIPGPTDITVAAATVQNVTSTPIEQNVTSPPTEQLLPRPTVTAMLTNTPVPVEVEVTDVNWYTTVIDSFYLIGIVQNTGGIDLNYVKVSVELKDGQGQVVASKYAFTSIGTLQSGTKSPFAVLFGDGVPDWDKYEITVEALESTEMDLYYNYTAFDIISNESAEPGYSDYAIQGEIKNTGQLDAEFVKVVAILYDEDNHITGTDWTYIRSDRSELASGESVIFTINILNIVNPVDHYELLVDARRVDDPQ